MRVPLDWAQRQFAAMGRPDARELAVQVVARYQGTALLTSTFRDPDLMTQEAARVAQWIDALDLPDRPHRRVHDVQVVVDAEGVAQRVRDYLVFVFPSAARTRRPALSPAHRLEFVVDPEK